ncbi:HAD family hydrolase [Streptomyces radicis]|uniref:HAD family phosphatase n=1 Tax=Streptomyces radicis TaxID=1750517 RepID=A0A3A9WC46_9ACTN|nr:HAD family phosphatase [Streptomyces radicis]RKN10222.1 HAD family phosphatase [Streptomyces radicis]RKN24564.1 HAD family phosphatase [Streptomyces radicis]
MAYRGLILDFGGVLTEGVRESVAAWAAAEGLPADAWATTLGEHPEGRALYRELERGALSQQEWNAATARLIGVAPENLMGRAWAGVRPAAGMVALAREAREAGLTVAMLSNSFGLDPYDPYGHVGVWDLFDVAVISEREGIAKPDPVIYQRVLERMGLTGAECVFVDDAPVNLPPARACDITTVHADPHGDPTATVARVATLLGLPGRVAAQPG